MGRMTTKQLILWVAVMLVAFGIGFGFGAALWEDNAYAILRGIVPKRPLWLIEDLPEPSGDY